ncbi:MULTISPECIES: hemopexin repeat-containing protein [Streptomyces]|uniref:Hemopexin repeat-containing protein n=1 Tax=Streptomyces galilaeus TaxID=33899 RepID=A0ABW9IXB2_STRGJ
MAVKVYFTKHGNYARYNVSPPGPPPDGFEYVKSIAANWGNFAAYGFDTDIDAAVNWPNGHVYFFKGEKYAKYNIQQNKITQDPHETKDYWDGFAGTGFDEYIDAALELGDGSAWFFRDDECLLFGEEKGTETVVVGPGKISTLLPDLASASFGSGAEGNFGSHLDDGVFMSGKGYLFKGEHYIRVTRSGDFLLVDADYPLKTKDQWVGFPPTFTAKNFQSIWIDPNHT